MSISIIHVITTLDLGGAEKQLLILAAKQQEVGNDVKVIFLKDCPKLLNKFRASGLKVETKFSNMTFLKQVLELRKERVAEKTVYHAHLPRAEFLCALALKSNTFVVTRHNSEPFFPKAPSFVSRILSKFVLRRAFASISISRAVTHYLMNSKELDNDSINEVVFYGLDNTTVKNKKHPKSKSKSKIYNIGTVARLVPQKNVSLLINAVQILNKTHPAAFHLSILGTGPMKEELRLLAVKLGLADLVDFFPPRLDVATFYKSLDLFVLPSHYEGFGLVLLEAMSAGVAVIARDVTSIPEVLGKDHPGLLKTNNPHDLANKIFDFFRDEHYLKECLLYQSEQIKNFSIDKTEIAHRNIYIRLLKQIELSSK